MRRGLSDSANQSYPAPTAEAPCPDAAAQRVAARPLLFLKQWLTNPLRMGSVVPSSPALCRRVVSEAWPAPGKAVLELGAGTGVISRALLAAGLPRSRLVVVEIEPSMAAHLRACLPGVEVLEGDARDLPTLLPQRWHGRIGNVVCGIPLVLLPKTEQRRFIDAMATVAPGRGFLHYSYCVTSPLPARAHGLHAKRAAWVALNFPPASLWRYEMS
jgi:phosphatidylethanolamine/phosphatidyl-N-methylethanolamine N-methyltransferase